MRPPVIASRRAGGGDAGAGGLGSTNRPGPMMLGLSRHAWHEGGSRDVYATGERQRFVPAVVNRTSAQRPCSASPP